MEFFGQTPGQFGGRIKGLLEDPEQQMALLSSPMFQMGMGLLNNPGNGAQGILQGLQSAKQHSNQDKDRERMQKLRTALADMLGVDPESVDAMAGGVQQPAGMPPAQPTGAPAGASFGGAGADMRQQAVAALTQQGKSNPTEQDIEMMLSIMASNAGM